MDATAWLTVSIVGFSLAGVGVIAAIFMFFKLNIPAIIGDLTGRTAARQIQEIREQNQLSGNKQYLPDRFNVERGTLTEPVHAPRGKSETMTRAQKLPAYLSKRLDLKGETESTSRAKEIESLPTDVLVPQEDYVFGQPEETTVLFFEKEKPVPVEVHPYETEVLDNGTEVLWEENGTTVLADNVDKDIRDEPVMQKVEFKIVKDIKITHTNEKI